MFKVLMLTIAKLLKIVTVVYSWIENTIWYAEKEMKIESGSWQIPENKVWERQDTEIERQR